MQMRNGKPLIACSSFVNSSLVRHSSFVFRRWIAFVYWKASE